MCETSMKLVERAVFVKSLLAAAALGVKRGLT